MRALAAAAALLACLVSPARAEEQCDVALVLAMDVSGSVTMPEFEMQRDGTADAFLDRRVAAAIASGRHGQIAVAVTQWSFTSDVAVPWRILRAGEIEGFADEVRAMNRLFSGGTNVSTAIVAAVDLFASAPCIAPRRVIDVSGDGKHNGGEPTMAYAQQRVEDADVEVNGLPIVNDEPDVVEWYRENVKSPTGFIIEARSFEEFGQAMRAKLALEIAGVRRQIASAP